MARNISASRRRAEWQQHLDVAAIPCLPKRRQERRSFCAAARLFIGGSRRIDRDRGVLQGGSYPRGFRGPPRRTGAASPMQRRQRRRRPSDDAAVHSGRWRPSSCFFGTAVQVVSEYRVLSVSLSARARQVEGRLRPRSAPPPLRPLGPARASIRASDDELPSLAAVCALGRRPHAVVPAAQCGQPGQALGQDRNPCTCNHPSV